MHITFVNYTQNFFPTFYQEEIFGIMCILM